MKQSTLYTVADFVKQLSELDQDLPVVFRRSEGSDGSYSDWRLSSPFDAYGTAVLSVFERIRDVPSISSK